MIYLIYLWVFAFATGNEGIEWHNWEAESFEKAKSQNKMIIVDVGMEGCTACRWMAEFTYTDENVIRLINDNFIAIQVDSEARPDIGERYSVPNLGGGRRSARVVAARLSRECPKLGLGTGEDCSRRLPGGCPLHARVPTDFCGAGRRLSGEDSGRGCARADQSSG